MAKFKDLTGAVFGNLTVLERAGIKGKFKMWRCACACGATAIVAGAYLTRGHTRSCGCMTRSMLAAASTTHGKVGTPEYRIWSDMKTRCFNPKRPCWADYGGRGITMCDRWRDDFSAFLEDMGPRPSAEHTVDRIDNDGPYCKENCRWTTMREQSRNRRSNHLVTINGETHPLIVWLERYGTVASRYKKRIKMGWSEFDAITRPFVKYGERGQRGSATASD
jgi:hypothetical protein